jgi:hypothetical protein
LDEQQDRRAEQLFERVLHARRVAQVSQVSREELRVPEPVRQLAHQQRSRFAAHALRPRLQVNGPVEFQGKECTL